MTSFDRSPAARMARYERERVEPVLQALRVELRRIFWKQTFLHVLQILLLAAALAAILWDIWVGAFFLAPNYNWDIPMHWIAAGTAAALIAVGEVWALSHKRNAARFLLAEALQLRSIARKGVPDANAVASYFDQFEALAARVSTTFPGLLAESAGRARAKEREARNAGTDASA